MAVIIVDPGSTHMGKLKYALEHIDRAADAGADVIKFQLFKNPKGYTGGNVELPLNWWPELEERAALKGIKLTASVFNQKMLSFLLKKKPEFIKLAYSKKDEAYWIGRILDEDIKPIVSCDVMTDRLIPRGCIKLYCIPEYPVRYEISFDGLFPRFDGFSDHSLGIRQTIKAIYAGARYIEKHTTLPHGDITCPDHNFAVQYKDISALKLVE